MISTAELATINIQTSSASYRRLISHPSNSGEVCRRYCRPLTVMARLHAARSTWQRRPPGRISIPTLVYRDRTTMLQRQPLFLRNERAWGKRRTGTSWAIMKMSAAMMAGCGCCYRDRCMVLRRRSVGHRCSTDCRPASSMCALRTQQTRSHSPVHRSIRWLRLRPCSWLILYSVVGRVCVYRNISHYFVISRMFWRKWRCQKRNRNSVDRISQDWASKNLRHRYVVIALVAALNLHICRSSKYGDLVSACCRTSVSELFAELVKNLIHRPIAVWISRTTVVQVH